MANIYYSTEDLYSIRQSIANLVALKTLYDLGYDVEGVRFWDESALGNYHNDHDDILQIALQNIFDVDPDEIEEAEAELGYAFQFPVPLILKLRELEEIPLLNKGISRFIVWFEERLDEALSEMCTDYVIKVTERGFFYDCFSDNEIHEVILPLEELKNKAKRYVLAMERGQSHGRNADSHIGE